MKPQRLITICSLASLALLSGCTSRGLGILAERLMKENAKLESADRIFSRTELILEATGSDTMKCSLVNHGAKTLELLPPMLDYTLQVRFFDGRGDEFFPPTVIAASLPGLNRSMRVFTQPGDSESETISRSQLRADYKDLGNCRFIAVEYCPSEFALEPFAKDDLDVPKLPLFSNPLPW